MIRETLCTRWREKPKNPTGIEDKHFTENDPGMKTRNQEAANLEESDGMCETVNKEISTAYWLGRFKWLENSPI